MTSAGKRLAMEYTYFAARSDTAAAAVLDWPRGPHVPPTQEAAAGLLSDVVAGVQFSQELGRFASLLTGEVVDLEGGEHFVAETDDERGVVLRVPRELTHVIASTDAARLHGLIPEWAEFEDFGDVDPDRLRTFADDLQRLSSAAVDAGGGVYSHGWA
jgi:hypothetical protein